MSNNEITPPPRLVQQWVAATESNDCIGAFPTNFEQRICTAAARWGADQELEACCEWLADDHTPVLGQRLRAARRPKPPSLKERALEAQQRMWIGGATRDDWELIRRALEALPDD